MRLHFNNKIYKVDITYPDFDKLTTAQKQDREVRILALVTHRLSQRNPPQKFQINANTLKDIDLPSDLISKVQRQFPHAKFPSSLLSRYKTERHLWEGAPLASSLKPASERRSSVFSLDSLSSAEKEDDADESISPLKTNKRLESQRHQFFKKFKK
jgi:hypothetical protein